MEMNTIRRPEAACYDGSKATISTSERVLLARVSGVVTLDSYVDLLAQVAAGMRQHSALAFVIDCSSAVVALEAADAHEVCMLADPRLRLLPGAWVVPDVNLSGFNAWMWGSLRRGYERTTFTKPSDALEWARQRAREVHALHLQELLYRGAGPSGPNEL